MFRLCFQWGIGVCVVAAVAIFSARLAGEARPRDWLAFAAYSDAPLMQVFAVDLSARLVMSVMPQRNSCSAEAPDWSGDGRLVFVQSCDGNMRMMLLDFGTARLDPLVEGSFDLENPVWSSDGRIAVGLRESGLSELYIVDPATRHLSHVASSTNIYGAAAWSNDGRLAFSAWPDSGYRVYVREVDGSVKNVKWSNSNLPAWSSDGRLAYAQWNPTAFDNAVYVRDAAGDVKVADFNIFNDVISWSPNGQLTVVINADSQNRDIALLDPLTGGITPLVQHPAQDVGARWSRDGRFLAFVSNRARADDYSVYVLNVATGEIMGVSGGLSVMYAPVWA